MTTREVYAKASEMAKPLRNLFQKREDAKQRGDEKACIALCAEISEVMCGIGDLIEKELPAH